MAATATASASVRYAPEDPTLPKPWKGLVDGRTGYLYFWNPETNITQYERPSSSVSASKSSSGPISSSVHQSAQGQHRSYCSEKEDDRYGRGTNGGSKLEDASRCYQVVVVLIFRIVISPLVVDWYISLCRHGSRFYFYLIRFPFDGSVAVCYKVKSAPSYQSNKLSP